MKGTADPLVVVALVFAAGNDLGKHLALPLLST